MMVYKKAENNLAVFLAWSLALILFLFAIGSLGATQNQSSMPQWNEASLENLPAHGQAIVQMESLKQEDEVYLALTYIRPELEDDYGNVLATDVAKITPQSSQAELLATTSQDLQSNASYIAGVRAFRMVDLEDRVGLIGGFFGGQEILQCEQTPQSYRTTIDGRCTQRLYGPPGSQDSINPNAKLATALQVVSEGDTDIYDLTDLIVTPGSTAELVSSNRLAIAKALSNTISVIELGEGRMENTLGRSFDAFEPFDSARSFEEIRGLTSHYSYQVPEFHQVSDNQYIVSGTISQPGWYQGLQNNIEEEGNDSVLQVLDSENLTLSTLRLEMLDFPEGLEASRKLSRLGFIPFFSNNLWQINGETHLVPVFRRFRADNGGLLQQNEITDLEIPSLVIEQTGSEIEVAGSQVTFRNLTPTRGEDQMRILPGDLSQGSALNMFELRNAINTDSIGGGTVSQLSDPPNSSLWNIPLFEGGELSEILTGNFLSRTENESFLDMDYTSIAEAVGLTSISDIEEGGGVDFSEITDSVKEFEFAGLTYAVTNKNDFPDITTEERFSNADLPVAGPLNNFYQLGNEYIALYGQSPMRNEITGKFRSSSEGNILYQVDFGNYTAFMPERITPKVSAYHLSLQQTSSQSGKGTESSERQSGDPELTWWEELLNEDWFIFLLAGLTVLIAYIFTPSKR